MDLNHYNLEFQCEICSEIFPADPDTMVTIEYSSYLIPNNNVDSTDPDLSWEGGPAPIKPGARKIKIECPIEFSNTAMCICKKCQSKLLPPVQSEEVDNDDR